MINQRRHTHAGSRSKYVRRQSEYPSSLLSTDLSGHRTWALVRFMIVRSTDAIAAAIPVYARAPRRTHIYTNIYDKNIYMVIIMLALGTLEIITVDLRGRIGARSTVGKTI